MAIQTYTAGQILTAASMTSLQQQAVMTFTTEAARDAALTAPSEGMYAYLTAPTQPAATGANSTLPTGIRTVYNGSAWVCITPVLASTIDEGNTTSTSYTATLTSGGTNPSVTIATGTIAQITISTRSYSSTTNIPVMSVAVSGATTISAATIDGSFGAVFTQGGLYNSGASVFVITGLTAGVNTFTLNYKTNATIGYFAYRAITAQGIA